jgi:O-antigen ligase
VIQAPPAVSLADVSVLRMLFEPHARVSMWKRNHRRLGLALAVVSVALSPLLAVMIGSERIRTLVTAILLAAGCFVIRWLLRPIRERGAELLREMGQPLRVSQGASVPVTSADTRYMLSRWLYYCGMVTVAVSAIRLRETFTLSDAFFLVALILLLIEILLRGDAELIFPRTVLWGAVLITAGSLISTPLAKDPAGSLIESLKYPYLMVIWFWMGGAVLRRVEHVYFAVGCCLLSAAISSSAAFGQMFFGLSFGAAAEVGGRAPGLSEHVSALGMVAAMELVPALMFVVHSRGIIRKSAFVIISIFTLGGLMLSVSMGGFGGAVASLVVWLVGFVQIKPLLRPRSLLLAALILAAAVGVSHFQSVQQLPSLAERLEDLASRHTGRNTVDSRLQTYQVAFDSFNRNPLVGVGRDSQSTETVMGLGVHNLLLLHLYEGGMLAFSGIILLLFGLGFVIWRTALMARTYEEWWLAVSIMLSSVAFVVDAMSEPVAHGRSNWVFGALAVALYGFQQRGYLSLRRRAFQPARPLASAGSSALA